MYDTEVSVHLDTSARPVEPMVSQTVCKDSD